jgi:hypothetical protein
MGFNAALPERSDFGTNDFAPNEGLNLESTQMLQGIEQGIANYFDLPAKVDSQNSDPATNDKEFATVGPRVDIEPDIS